jgi:hypothetical protein
MTYSVFFLTRHPNVPGGDFLSGFSMGFALKNQYGLAHAQRSCIDKVLTCGEKLKLDSTGSVSLNRRLLLADTGVMDAIVGP